MREILRKSAALMLVLVMLFTSTLTVSAAPTPEELGMIPLRAVFEATGAEVVWNDDNRSINVTLLTGDEFVFFADHPAALVNGAQVSLNYGITLWEDTAFLPAEDFADIYGVLAQQLGDAGHLGVTIMETTQVGYLVLDMLNVPGMTVAIVDAVNDFTWTYGFGYADVAGGVPIDEFTLFNLASISKPFTAIAVMQLVEQGIIDLDEPVTTYLPNFRVPSDMVIPGVDVSGTGDYRNITVRMLLSHASGLQNDFMASGVLTSVDYNPDFMDTFIELLAEFPMLTPEASVFSYNNNAYTLLGVMLAHLAGYDSAFFGYQSVMDENIFRPLGMELSTFILEDRHMARLAHPYIDADNRDEKLFYNPLPTGGIFSNAHDMARFMHMILNGGVLDGVRILEESTLAQMFTHQNFNFAEAPDVMMNMRPGIGFIHTTELTGFEHWGHGGNLIHYHSHMAFDLDAGIGVFVSVNSLSGINVSPDQLAALVLQWAVFETTGAVNVPESDETVYPVALSIDELMSIEGFYSFPNASEFVHIVASEEGVLVLNNFPGLAQPLVLLPLSDGSFLCTELGLRFWFEEFHGEMIMILGEFQSMIAGGRLNTEYITATPEFEQWIGEYVAVTEGNHVSLVYSAEVGIDDNGFAYMRIRTLNAFNPISPLVYLGDGNFSGIQFSLIDGEAWLEFSGVRMVRQ